MINDDNAVRLTQTFSRRHLKSRGYGYWYTDYDIYSYEFTPEWINTTKLGAFDNELIVGATFRYDRNDAANWGTSSYGYSHSKYEYDRQTMGFYAQDTFKITEDIALEVGGRYERSWNKCTMAADPRRAYDLTAWDAALNFTPVEGLKAYAKFSNFYRMPFIDEVAYHSRDDLLSPEHGWRADVGFDWSFLEEFNVAGNAYVSRTKNEIFYNPLFPYMSFGYPAFGDNVNSPSPVMREGFDLRASWERDKVAGVSIAYSFVDAEFDGGEFDGNDVPMVAKSVVTASGRVWLWDDCFVFGGYRFRTDCRSTSDFANEYEKIPSFGLFHVGVQYSPTCFGLDGLTLAFTVDNLFRQELLRLLDLRHGLLAWRRPQLHVHDPLRILAGGGALERGTGLVDLECPDRDHAGLELLLYALGERKGEIVHLPLRHQTASLPIGWRMTSSPAAAQETIKEAAAEMTQTIGRFIRGFSCPWTPGTL